MKRPVQAMPVRRAIVSYSSNGANGGLAPSLFGSSNGVVASSGVEAAGWLDDITRVVGTVGDVVKTAGPILGAFGI